MLPRTLPGRLSLLLEQVPETVFEPEFVADVPLVRFEAYAEHARIFGWVRLKADRLTDLLNAHEEIHLANVEIESLVDGEVGTADEVLVPRHELIAVFAAGPKGDDSRRRRTRIHPIAIQSGNYLIGGHLHAPPGVDPIASVAERPPMVPLTDAWIEYWSGGQRRRQWVGTIVVNRDLADWLRVVTDADLEFGKIRPRSSIT